MILSKIFMLSFKKKVEFFPKILSSCVKPQISPEASIMLFCIGIDVCVSDLGPFFSLKAGNT